MLQGKIHHWQFTDVKKGITDTCKRSTIDFSLGFISTYFTALLGFKPNEGEYKMMGMTPYGTPKYLEKIKMHLGYRSGDPLSLVVPEYMYVQGKIDLRRQEMVEILEIEDPSILNDDKGFIYSQSKYSLKCSGIY